MAHKKIKRFQEGGMSEDEDKAAGLEASRDDKVGFLERLRMGNIDDSSSEAYKRFGAGRGRAARVPVEDRAGTPVEEIRARDTSAPAASGPSMTITDAMKDAAVAEGMRTGPDNPRESGPAIMMPATGPAVGGKPRVNVNAEKPAASQLRSSSPAPGKAAAPASNAAAMFRSSERASRGTPANTASTSKPSAPVPRKSAMDMIPTDGYRKVEGGERIDSSELGRNVNNALNAVVPGPARAVNAAKSAVKAGSRALREVEKAETPVTYLGKSGRRQISGFDEVAGTGGSPRLGTSPLSLRGASDTKKLPPPTKRLGYKKPDDAPSKRANPASKRTKKSNDDEADIDFKRGGSVSPASKRADGIATRGKTRCKIC